MDMEQRTKITLAWELHEQGLSNSQIARRLEISRKPSTAGLPLLGSRVCSLFWSNAPLRLPTQGEKEADGDQLTGPEFGPRVFDKVGQGVIYAAKPLGDKLLLGQAACSW